MAKSTKIGTIPCLVCGEPFKYLTTSHMQTHPPGYPQNDPEYWAWAAEKWGVDEDDVSLSPSEWREQKHLFSDWRKETINRK